MSDFAVTISCRLNEDSNEVTTFVLDTVNDNTVSSSSTITTHPVISGDIVADHMYNNPDSMSISGVFSLNGSKGIIVDNEGTRLEEVQELFEKIKRNGILCDIVKIHVISSNEKAEPRFKTRTNMVLTNIQWVEKINSLNFSFTFSQAILVDTNLIDLDMDDQYLPNITEPATLNFTDSLIDWDSVDNLVMEIGRKFDLFEEGFLRYVSGLGQASLIGLGIGVATAIVVAKIGAALGLSSGPIGLIAGAVIGLGIALYLSIKKAIEKNKYKVQQFKYYQDDKKNQQEVKRFANFVGDIHKQITQLNNYIKVYNIGSDEPQECMLTIGNNYYIFTFTKNNVSQNYSLVITDIEEKERGIVNNITSALNNFTQCKSNNYIMRADESGEYVYLICSNEDKTKLTNYNILVSSINLDEYNNMLEKIITNAITY